MSHRDEEEVEYILRGLVREESNRTCAECDDRRPRFVVMDFGVFVCSLCAGVHREMGRTVKNLESSPISVSEAYTISDMGGNAAARRKWMAKWSARDFPEPKPGDDPERVREFIWLKYDGSWTLEGPDGARYRDGGGGGSRGGRYDRELDRGDRYGGGRTSRYDEYDYNSGGRGAGRWDPVPPPPPPRGYGYDRYDPMPRGSRYDDFNSDESYEDEEDERATSRRKDKKKSKSKKKSSSKSSSTKEKDSYVRKVEDLFGKAGSMPTPGMGMAGMMNGMYGMNGGMRGMNGMAMPGMANMAMGGMGNISGMGNMRGMNPMGMNPMGMNPMGNMAGQMGMMGTSMNGMSGMGMGRGSGMGMGMGGMNMSGMGTGGGMMNGSGQSPFLALPPIPVSNLSGGTTTGMATSQAPSMHAQTLPGNRSMDNEEDDILNSLKPIGGLSLNNNVPRSSIASHNVTSPVRSAPTQTSRPVAPTQPSHGTPLVDTSGFPTGDANPFDDF